MYKPVPRVLLVAVIGIVLVAAAYLTAQGAFAKAETSGVQAHVVNGLQTNFNHDRSTISELDALQLQSDPASQPGTGRHEGGCESEQQSAPLD